MKVAVLGATGAVGRVMLAVLEERLGEVEEVAPLASAASAGATVPWRGRDWTVAPPDAGSFRDCALALFSAGAAVSRAWAEAAVAEGAVVVDNSSAWRMDAQVPLVVPEVNGERIRERPKGIIANPNCSTIQAVLPLEALHDAFGLRRVVYTTYQSASGAGEQGLRALERELEGFRGGASPFPTVLAGNVIPSVGAQADGGWTEEEDKMRAETRKILEIPDLPVAATCARVPVAVGHSVAVTVEIERPVTRAEAVAAIGAQQGLTLEERPHGPLAREAAGSDAVRVGRIRVDRDRPDTLHFWVVADNLRKGAALNAVQIAERVLAESGVAA
ncbi:MAG TPA: aspartate-semialdehyde dehydrogenase [Longimicrobiales bacterium]|nr:aspartate-semialdehyde dehydrogenase [Longimicrobiales bacterium]